MCTWKDRYLHVCGHPVEGRFDQQCPAKLALFERENKYERCADTEPYQPRYDLCPNCAESARRRAEDDARSKREEGPRIKREPEE